MRDDKAAVVAFFVAPVVPAIFFALSSPGLGGGFGTDFASLLTLSVLGYFCSLVAVGLMGLQAFLILRRYALDTVSVTIAAGGLLGLLVAFVITARLSYLSALDWLWQSRELVIIGGTTALAFGAVRALGLRGASTAAKLGSDSDKRHIG